MLVECTKAPRAYLNVPELPEDARNVYNLAGTVELVERPTPGGDDAPVLVEAGCGHVFDFGLDVRLWDCNTDADGLYVIERHVAAKCPKCGRTADYLSEPVEAEPLRYVDKSERARAVMLEHVLREDPDVAKWSDERITTLIERLVNPPSGGALIGYTHVTEGAVALSAATAKTILGAKAGAAAGLLTRHVSVGFDGVTASAVPVLVEFGYCTFSANSPGTNSTGTTERQDFGRSLSADWTGGRNWTTEPTTITVLEERLLTPYGGLVVYDYPLGEEPDTALAEGHVIRCNAPAAVNVRATQKVRRI